jgi:hypothetical protein
MFKKRVSHEKAIKIQESATRKLMDYIYSYIRSEKFKNKNIPFSFEGSSEKDTAITFNVWFSLDYIVDKGKNFTELFLEDCKDKLTENEKEILKERNKTYISLYEVEEIKGKNLVLTDIFTQERKTVYQEKIADMGIYNSIIVGRIGNVLGYNKLIGIIHFISIINKEYLYNTILYDYEVEKNNNPDIRDIKDYLRKFSNRVYYFLNNALDEKNEDQLMSIKSENQIKGFSEYLLENNLTEKTVNKHIRNLVNFYYYYLPTTKYSLEDITETIINNFLIDAIFDNYISSKSEISSYITTFKKYGKYLYKTGKINEEEYNKIIGLSSNKNEYFLKLDYLDNGFSEEYSINELFSDIPEEVKNRLEYDNCLKNIIEQYNTKEKSSIIDDFQTYMNYILTNKVKVTNINKYIGRKHVIALNELMNNKEENITKSVNQNNIPLLHLFYHFGIYYSLLIVDEKGIYVDEAKLAEYEELETSEKLALFIDYIWNKSNWDDFDSYGWERHKDEYDNRNKYVKTLAILDVGKYYQYSQVINLHDIENLNNLSDDGQIDFFDLFNSGFSMESMRFAYIFNTVIIRFFSYLSLIEIKVNKDANTYQKKFGIDIEEIKVNEIGKRVFEYLSGEKIEKTKKSKDKGKIINLFNKKKGK